MASTFTIAGAGALAGAGAGSAPGVAAISGLGALSGGGGSNQGAFSIPGSGAVSWDAGTTPGLTVATISGAGTIAWVGSAASKAVLTATGVGALSGLSKGASAGVASLSGSGALSGVGASTAASAAAIAGSGAFDSFVVTEDGAFNIAADGALVARGAWSNDLPFNYPPSWSIMLYGSVIEGAAYDPTLHALKIWFTGSGGQFIILYGIPLGTTNAIEAAPDPQTYVLALIRANP